MITAKTEATQKAAILTVRPALNTLAGFVRTDINPTQNGAFGRRSSRQDSVRPDKTYAAYEFVSTYKLNDNNIVRVAVNALTADRSLVGNYLNVVQPTPVPGIDGTQKGNTNMKLFTINMVEVGYRVKANNKLQFDIDLFHQKLKLYSCIGRWVQRHHQPQ